MAVQDRPTLKGYFNTGDVPTEAQFADLIDTLPVTPSDIDAAPALTADENYVTDAEKVAIQSLGSFVTIEQVQDNLGGTTGGDGFVKTGDEHLTIVYDDAGNALTFTVIPSVTKLPTGIEFGGTTQLYDVSGTTFINAVAGGTLGGIPDSASAGHTLADCIDAISISRDNKYLNVQEASGAASATNPLTVQFLFSGITAFEQIKTRSYYIGSVGHNMAIQLWNFTTSAWDSYATFSGEADYISRNLEVFSPTLYISGGVVKLQFIHTSTGNATHQIIFDYVALTNGGGGSGGASIASAVSAVATSPETASNVQTQLNNRPNYNVLGALATGLLKVTTTTGALSAAAASDVTGQLITGFSSGAGTVAATDTILQAINKLNGNIGAIASGALAIQALGTKDTNYTVDFNSGRFATATVGTGVATVTLSDWALSTESVDAWLYITQHASTARQQTLAITNMKSQGGLGKALPYSGAALVDAYKFTWMGTDWILSDTLFDIKDMA